MGGVTGAIVAPNPSDGQLGVREGYPNGALWAGGGLQYADGDSGSGRAGTSDGSTDVQELLSEAQGRAAGALLNALATPVPTPAEVLDVPDSPTVVAAELSVSTVQARQAVSLGVQVLRATYYGTPGDGYGYNCPAQCVTASGDWFDPDGLTAASRTYKLGTELLVCYAGSCVGVRVNDRCGACTLDLSRGAFERLAPLSMGVIQVEVRVIQ